MYFYLDFRYQKRNKVQDGIEVDMQLKLVWGVTGMLKLEGRNVILRSLVLCLVAGLVYPFFILSHTSQPPIIKPSFKARSSQFLFVLNINFASVFYLDTEMNTRIIRRNLYLHYILLLQKTN